MRIFKTFVKCLFFGGISFFYDNSTRLTCTRDFSFVVSALVV